MDRSACGFSARAGDGCHETWQPPGSRTQLPRAVFPEPRVSCAPARSLVPGSPWRSCTYQHALPREVAATPFSTMIATRHSMRCHARTPHSQKLTQRSSAHPTPAAPDPHSPTWGQDPRHVPRRCHHRIIGDRLEQVLRDGFAQPLQGNHVQRLMKRMLSECRDWQ